MMILDIEINLDISKNYIELKIWRYMFKFIMIFLN